MSPLPGYIYREDCKPLNPDLIIIMLNPGSCDGKNLDQDTEVAPDRTLKRIQKIFDYCDNIKWIRILNLSDIRNNDSKKFFRNDLKTRDDMEHSIFSNSRFEELKGYIKEKDAVLFAFGTDKKNKVLMERAISTLKKIQPKIIEINNAGKEQFNKEPKYYHPLVRIAGISWTQRVVDAIKSQLP